MSDDPRLSAVAIALSQAEELGAGPSEYWHFQAHAFIAAFDALVAMQEQEAALTAKHHAARDDAAQANFDDTAAEIAALRERNRLLHEALRQEGIGWRDEQHRRCGRCRYEWHEYEPESHAPDCLAAPAKEEG